MSMSLAQKLAADSIAAGARGGWRAGGGASDE